MSSDLAKTRLPSYNSANDTGSAGETGRAVESTSEAPPPSWFARRGQQQPEEAAETAEAGSANSAVQPPPLPGESSRKSRKSSVPPRRQKRAPLIQPIVDGEAPVGWQQRFKNGLKGSAAAGYMLSLLIHAIVLVATSLIVVNHINENKTFLTWLTENDEEVVTFDESLSSELELPSQESSAQMPEMVQVPLDTTTEVQPEFPISDAEMSVDSADNDGKEAGDGAGGGKTVPKGNNAVTKGSFTAWTVPENPRPGQTYLIIIQIELPKGVKRYPRSDLAGTVVGTDQYRQVLPGGSTRGFLPMQENVAQLVVAVPGAQALVEDTIRIQSRRILKETQVLKIVFSDPEREMRRGRRPFEEP